MCSFINHKIGCLSILTTPPIPHQSREKVEERIPVVDKAVGAVNAATVKIKQLRLQLDDNRAMIDHYRLKLGATAAEIESTRERSDKLEARFTQVRAHGTVRYGALRYFLCTA